MLAEVITTLDRRFRATTRADLTPTETLVEVHAFVEFVRSDPHLAPLFSDLLREGAAHLEAIHEADRALIEQLECIRERLVQLYPDENDADTPRPSANMFDCSFDQTLARFDELAGAHGTTRIPLDPSDTEDESRSRMMIEILNAKRNHGGESGGYDKELDALLWNARERLTRQHREWVLFSKSSPGAAAHRLEGIRRHLLPEPWLREADADIVEMANRALAASFHQLDALRAKVYGEQRDASDDASDARSSALVQTTVSRVYEELRARLGTARSHRTLVERFRLRAQLYEAAYLREVSEDAARAEDTLVQKLCAYLFDQGLNPITRPLVGKLEPDVLDSGAGWTFYVEAKQYSCSRGRRTIVRGMPQVWDTLSFLQGNPHRVREAFYVVFRRDGPRYVLPSELAAEGVVVYPVLVDIAPAASSGSRQRHRPIVIPESELLPSPA